MPEGQSSTPSHQTVALMQASNSGHLYWHSSGFIMNNPRPFGGTSLLEHDNKKSFQRDELSELLFIAIIYHFSRIKTGQFQFRIDFPYASDISSIHPSRNCCAMHSYKLKCFPPPRPCLFIAYFITFKKKRHINYTGIHKKTYHMNLDICLLSLNVRRKAFYSIKQRKDFLKVF